MDNAYSDALAVLLRDHCTPARVRAVESGQGGDALWQVLHESGFADCLLPETAGGAALALTDVAPLLFVIGQHALPLPLGQTMFARAVLHRAGIGIPAGPIALASFDAAQRTHVSCGATAAWFLVQDGGHAALVRRAEADVEETGVHGDLTVSIGRPPVTGFPLAPGALRTMGACVHAAQMAGAMARVFDMTLQYANDREQFGRPVGKFQAIQHQISVMAEQVAAVRMAAQVACASADAWPDPIRVAIGKLNASDAVATVTAIAHAVHGAIGITEEYDLQLLTRRLHAWRLADGSERYWAREIGAAACEAEAGAVDLIRSWSTDAA